VLWPKPVPLYFLHTWLDSSKDLQDLDYPQEYKVNLKDATWDNSIGATELKAVWADPDFNPELEAFYYVRVIEIPTPRWTLYDKLMYGAKLGEEIPLTTTERAYTSPIWYSPN